MLYLIGLVNGGSTPVDHSYVVDYDPARRFRDGSPYLTWTKDQGKARTFASSAAALAYWKQDTGMKRADGKPDRPLTAFNAEVLKVGQQPLF